MRGSLCPCACRCVWRGVRAGREGRGLDHRAGDRARRQAHCARPADPARHDGRQVLPLRPAHLESGRLLLLHLLLQERRRLVQGLPRTARGCRPGRLVSDDGDHQGDGNGREARGLEKRGGRAHRGVPLDDERRLPHAAQHRVRRVEAGGVCGAGPREQDRRRQPARVHLRAGAREYRRGGAAGVRGRCGAGALRRRRVRGAAVQSADEAGGVRSGGGVRQKGRQAVRVLRAAAVDHGTTVRRTAATATC